MNLEGTAIAVCYGEELVACVSKIIRCSMKRGMILRTTANVNVSRTSPHSFCTIQMENYISHTFQLILLTMERNDPCLPFNPCNIYTFIREIKARLLCRTSALKIKIVHGVKEYAWCANVQFSENKITLFGME